MTYQPLRHAASARALVTQLRTREADKRAVLFIDAAGVRTAVTYGELPALIDNVIARVGPQSGSSRLRVALLVRNQPHTPALLLGLLAAGCVVIPINPDSFPGDIEFILQDAKVDLVVADQEAVKLPVEIPSGISFARLLEMVSPEGRGLPIELPSVPATEPSLIMYTSGTTNRPKGVMLSEPSVFRNSGLIADHFQLNGSTQLTTLPMYHAHAFHFGFLSSLLTGGQLVVLQNFDPILWAETIASEGVDWTSVVPSLQPLLLASGVRREICPTLRGVLVSSAAIHEGLAREFENTSGIPMIHAWGQTEYTCWSNVCDIDGGPWQFDGAKRSVGPALPSVSTGVYRGDNTACAEGEEGELYLAGPCAMLGYLGNPELTRQTVTGLGVRTGDIGYYRVIDGQACYFVTGRIKEVINRAGEKLSPASIEAVIHERFPQAHGLLAVVGFDHEVIGEEIGVVIDSRLFSKAGADKDAVLAGLKTLHQTYRPRVVLISNEAINHTFTGKVQRSKLKNRFAEFAAVTSRFQVVDTTV